MSEKVTATLRVNLSEELAKKLEELKKFFGLTTDSEMVRFLIADKHREIKENEKGKKS